MIRGRPQLSVYVHYPYCSRICSFCAFNKYKLPQSLDNQALFHRYRRELSYNLAKYSQAGFDDIRSVYFGGGTPSLAPQLVSEILSQIRQDGFSITDAEITIEANPTSLPDVQYLQSLGVTRVSLGAQSLVSDTQLRDFNREHTARDSILSLERLSRDKHYLADGFSFDLMFGLPLSKSPDCQTDAFNKEVQVAIPFALDGGHLSLYELTVEHGTPLSKSVRQGSTVMPDEDDRADQYQNAIESLTSQGFDHYEVSSFALPGHYSRHNMAFWMHDDLIGIGPGAHGRVTENGTKYRTRCIPEPKRWSEQIEEIGHGQVRRDSLQSTFAEECIAIGLRTDVGVSRSKFHAATGIHLESCIDLRKVQELQEEGLLVWNEKGEFKSNLPTEYRDSYLNGYLRATERGRSLLDLIIPMILKD